MNNKNKVVPKKRITHFTLRNDYAFKKIFGTEANKNILMDFLSKVIDIEINEVADIRLKNPELIRDVFSSKTSRLDIRLELKNGEKIDIEMQNRLHDYYINRCILYASKLYAYNFNEGGMYQDLKKTISINIVNNRFKKSKKIRSIYTLKEREEGRELSDILQIHFLDLTKLPKESSDERRLDKLSPLEKWLMFIKTEESEVRNMLTKKNQAMEKANLAMKNFALNEEEYLRYEKALEAEWERNSMINEGEIRGIKIGETRGRQEGIKIGETRGIKIGENRGEIKGMLLLGAELSKISELTGASEAAILEIKNNMGKN